MPGSRNIIGIKNPAIDTLIDRVIFTKDRDDLVAATKALDRVLLWNYYVVPQWTYPKVAHRALGPLRPSELPKYGLSGFPTLWWWDADKAAKIGSDLEGFSAHGAAFPPARAWSRHRRVCAARLRRGGADYDAEFMAYRHSAI